MFGNFVLDVELQSTVKPYPHQDMCLFFGFQATNRAANGLVIGTGASIASGAVGAVALGTNAVSSKSGAIAIGGDVAPGGQLLTHEPAGKRPESRRHRAGQVIPGKHRRLFLIGNRL